MELNQPLRWEDLTQGMLVSCQIQFGTSEEIIPVEGIIEVDAIGMPWICHDEDRLAKGRILEEYYKTHPANLPATGKKYGWFVDLWVTKIVYKGMKETK